ncbi:lipase family protein [Kiritimatiellota bacterium B12222]|nr:lipase family protein [Kiritimatiellota bacterium B12222]
MIKALPDPKKRDLIPPDMDHVYFEHGEDFPMEPRVLAYSAVNAWWFAEFSFLVYCHPGFARLATKLAGFDAFRFLNGKGTECMISANTEVVVVAFRGTELKSRSAFHEVKTDLNTLPVSFEKGGKVHAGFLDGLDEIWSGDQGLEALLHAVWAEDPERPIWLTGHSMGGALASLCFSRFPAATGLYIYGAPRVGDRAFGESCGDRPMYRIENVRDPVPLMPPDVPKLKYRFSDLGELKFLDGDGQVLEERPMFVMEDHKAGYREAKEMLDAKFSELKHSLELSKAGLSRSKSLLKEVEAHQRIHRREWRAQLKRSLKQFGLSLDDHQPLYYAVKTWNAVLQSMEEK